MLKKLSRIFGGNTKSPQRTLLAHEHGVDPNQVSKGAKLTIAQLKNYGYSAYLVGGGVRDLLLDGRPKDFDVATNATPNQVKKVFRNARIIGKRFQIVHVRFGREIIEVTTFRASHENSKGKDAHQSDRGVLLRDNVFGDIQSDALRRDFTINALYYDSETQELIDFTKGLEDLKTRTLRLIGDPESRYKEDPVRMLRAVRFAAKLGFKLESNTEAPIRAHANYLEEIPAARLFEEVLKLMLSGSSLATLTMLQDYGLFAHLFPTTQAALDSNEPHYANIVQQTAVNTDKRIRQQLRVTPAFFFATFLWPPLQRRISQLKQEQDTNDYEAMQRAASDVIGQQLVRTAIPKRFLIPMREIWNLQSRLQRREGQRAYQLLEHPRFRAAYDFTLLREQAGEDLGGLGEWWTQFQAADQEQRGVMLKALGPGKRSRRRSVRKQKKPPSSP